MADNLLSQRPLPEGENLYAAVAECQMVALVFGDYRAGEERTCLHCLQQSFDFAILALVRQADTRLNSLDDGMADETYSNSRSTGMRKSI